jgi:type IV secretion system protein VirD4
MKQRFEDRSKYVGTACLIVLILLLAEVVLFVPSLSLNAFMPALLPAWQTLHTLLAILFTLGIVGVIAWVWYALTHARPSGTYGTAHFASRREAQQAGGVATNGPSSNKPDRHVLTSPPHIRAKPAIKREIVPTVAAQKSTGNSTAVQEDESHFHLGVYKNLDIALSEDQQEGHVLIVAPTKRGKTAGIIIPNLLRECGRRSLFIHDIKHELIDLCIGAIAEHHTCYILSPTRPDESNGYNPLAHMAPESLSGARNIAECIVRNTGTSKEPFWDNAARLLLTAALLHLRTAEPDAPFSRLTDICTLSLPEISDLITQSPSALAQRVGASFVKNVAAEPRLQSNVMTDMATRLFDVMDPIVERITTYDDLDFGRLSNEPSALFLHIPPYEATRLRWLSSCLIMQLITYLFEHPHSKRFAFYLDELANAGYIPNYLEYISYIRSAGVAFLQVIQDFGQLERIYEEHGKETILANSGTQIFLSGVGQVEAEYASRVIGETTVLARSESSERERVTYAETARKLMNPNEIRSMPLWDLLVLMGNTPPMIVKNRPYFQQPELQARIRLPYLPPTRVHPIPPTPPTPPKSSIAPRDYDAYTLPFDENLFDDEDAANDESL